MSIQGRVVAPDADPGWHELATGWFEGLKESGQAQFFEPSDWQAARYVAEVMTRHLSRAQPSAQLFSGIWGAMGDLMTTEAQRRKLRVEIERVPELVEVPEVVSLDERRRALGG